MRRGGVALGCHPAGIGEGEGEGEEGGGRGESQWFHSQTVYVENIIMLYPREIIPSRVSPNPLGSTAGASSVCYKLKHKQIRIFNQVKEVPQDLHCL